MRKMFAQVITEQCNHEDHFFITGDLGFMALEEVQAAFGNRFINAGVAEQNMVGVAAGLAREGFTVFIYSIAPFCYARPFEQIRNDICFSQLPVCLVGNGGGYAYGHMGPTHHALEDCAAMNALGVRVLVPAFDEDLAAMLTHIKGPTYLRLGYDAKPKTASQLEYDPWREVLPGNQGAIASLGPLAGVSWQALLDLPIEQRPAVWAVTEFNEQAIPKLFWNQIEGKPLFVTEEHVASGGLGMHITLAMTKMGVKPSRFGHRYALGYPTGRYGSQAFHRAQSALDSDGVRALVMESA